MTGTPATSDTIELPDGRRLHVLAEDGFGGVIDAFVANFVERDDLGAACTVFAGGRVVVDAWGGIADQRVGRTWDPDTAAVIFSCTKGLLAVCAYRLFDQGRLELDAPIAGYWPEFAAAGKDAITVRDAMAHRAGLPCLDVDLTRDEALTWAAVIGAIERARPLFLPSDGHLYHALTYGWLVGEVIHRVTGLLPGRYFRQEIGDPLHLDTWIGVPSDVRPRIAWMEPPLPDEDSEDAREAARLSQDNLVVERSLSMGNAWGFPVEDGVVSFNDPAIQAAEVPGANGVSTARSLAGVYSACVSAGAGPALLSARALDDALVVRSEGPQLSGLPDDGARWGTGFQLASPPSQPMLGPGSFGHAGAGGQLAFGDRDHGIGFAYLSDQMGGYGDGRARELTLAVRRAVRA
jgi:CubicO group peptidase (beta-lactamase class C family)